MDELDLAGAHEPRGVDVDQAAAEHVRAQQDLAGAPLELRKVELGRGDVRGAGLEARDAAAGDEEQASGDRGAQADHRRQRVRQVEPGDEVVDPPEPLTGRVEQRAPRERGEVQNAFRHCLRHSVVVARVEFVSIVREAGGPMLPILMVMSIDLRADGGGWARRAGLLGACAAILAACGTPAVVTPVKDPLPGFSRAITDAQNAVQQASNDSNGEALTNVTAPAVTTP